MAGFSGPVAAQESTGESAAVSEPDARGKSAAVSLFRADRPILLAGHSSHRSHSSHSSHRSSSGGDVYYPPSPPPPPPPPPPRARLNTLLTLPSAETQSESGFVAIVHQVQSGLKAYGYYDGPIDDQVGPGTRAALLRMQADYGLKQTGTITPEVLQALNID
jgi:His-Xaa-Ser repeat protein HxsA